MSRGGKRSGAGRPAGAKGKVTLELREAAQAYTDDALKTLAQVMKSGTGPARVAAAKELLDRGHGKSHERKDINITLTLEQIITEVPVLDVSFSTPAALEDRT